MAKDKNKRKIINKANQLFKLIDSKLINLSEEKMTSDDKHTLIDYDTDLRKITQKLIDKWSE